MVSHLSSERTRLLSDLHRIETLNASLSSQLQALQSARSAQTEDSHQNTHTHSQITQLEAYTATLHQELDELKLLLDTKTNDNAHLKADLHAHQVKQAGISEMLIKAEMENHHHIEELEIYKEKLAGFHVLEASLEKFKAKVESLTSLKAANKELHSQVDNYLDKIHELESSNKVLSNSSKLVETYKNKMIETEREHFEAIARNRIYEETIAQLQAEVKRLQQGRHQLQEELGNMQQQLQQREQLLQGAGQATGLDEEEDGQSIASLIALKEKVKYLEYELNIYKAGNSTSNNPSSGTGNEFLHELETMKAVKADREEMLHAANKQIASLTFENQKLGQRVAELETQSTANQTTAAAVQAQAGQAAASEAATTAFKESQQRLQISTATIALLENKLKEKESLINKLEADKNKLEMYTRRSLTTFKEKFMTILNTLKAEKKELEEKLALQYNKYSKLNGMYMKEERLLSSALFEVGVKMMDMNIHSQLAGHGSNAAGGSSFLQIQRDALKYSQQELYLQRTPIHTITGSSNGGSSNASSVNKSMMTAVGSPSAGAPSTPISK
jgi:chromosome segregation ATPase